jgi:nucleotide-binding universal stress UspA family protein
MLFRPKNILCAIDFSSGAAQILRWATLFATAFRARLEIFHADWWEPPRYFTSAQLESLASQAQQHRRAAEAELRRIAQEILGSEHGYETRVDSGHPAVLILQRAKALPADLIVVGSHGRTGLARWRLGSVAEDVVRQAAPPVLVVKGFQQAAARPEVKHVLCPVNFTLLARECLEVSSAVAEALHARLTVLHAMEDTSESLEQKHHDLCAWVPASVRGKCEIAEVVRSGNAAEQILTLAREQAADLIVLGAEHRPLLEALTWGTTTERVLRHSETSVLAVPRKLV